MKSLLVSFYMILMASCGESKESVEIIESIESKNSQIEMTRLQKFLDSSYKACVLNEADCPKAVVPFRPARPSKESKGQRILIIDSERQPHFKSSLLMRKSRVLGYYRFKGDFFESLENFRLNLVAPEPLLNFFQDKEFLDAKRHGLESLNLNLFQLLKLHHRVNWEGVPLEEIAHGEYIFEILSMMNPESQFVVTPFPELEREKLCSIEEDKINVEEIFKKSAASFLEIIKKYEINYVNLSYASTINSLERHNRFLCSGKLKQETLRRYLRAKIGFLDELSKGAPETMFFIALPNEYENTFFQDKDSMGFSCKKRKNFFRVSYWAYPLEKSHSLDEKHLRRWFPENQNRLWDFADFFVNRGSFDKPGTLWDPKRPSLQLYYFSVYPSTDFLMSNSFATPLALSYVNYFMRTYGKLPPLEEKIIDPILNKFLLVE